MWWAALAFAVLLMFVTIVMLVHLAFADRNKVPPVMTPGRVLDQVVAALDVPTRGVVYDLGCGTGRVLDAVLRRVPGARAVGVDNNPVLIAAARFQLGARAHIRYGQILRQDLSEADRVFTYLGPELMTWLEPKLEQELKPGARLVSQQFPLPNRKPDHTIQLRKGKPYAKRLYVYDY